MSGSDLQEYSRPCGLVSRGEWVGILKIVFRSQDCLPMEQREMKTDVRSCGAQTRFPIALQGTVARTAPHMVSLSAKVLQEFPETGGPIPTLEKSCEDVGILVGQVPFQIQNLSLSFVINLIYNK